MRRRGPGRRQACSLFSAWRTQPRLLAGDGVKSCDKKLLKVHQHFVNHQRSTHVKRCSWPCVFILHLCLNGVAYCVFVLRCANK